MEVEFFCMNADEGRAQILAGLISTHLDPGAKFVVRNVETSHDRVKSVLRYQQLLQASIPPALGLTVDVKTLDWYRNRVYVDMYWTVMSYNSSEQEDGTTVSESVQVTQRDSFALDSGGMERLLPALAIRDQMVLLPIGNVQMLQRVATERGIELQSDVINVDFRDDAALDRAIRSVTRRLHQEIKHEVINYRSFSRGEINMEVMARDLGLSAVLLARALKQEADAVTSTYQLLTCVLDQKELVLGQWTKVALNVRNDTSDELRGTKVSIWGPAEVLPRDIELDLPAHSSVAVNISIKPKDLGDFPLEIVLVLPADRILSEWLPRHHIWMQSVTRRLGKATHGGTRRVNADHRGDAADK